MIFTRIVSVLIATAACAQALRVPNALSVEDVDVAPNTAARELSDRTLHTSSAVRDLAESNNLNVAVPAARSLPALELRSDDVIYHIDVTPPGSRSPSPGPYECKTKADCQQKIDYARTQVAEAKTYVTKWTNALKAAGKDKEKASEAKNNLDTARGSLEHWQEEIEDYTKMQGKMQE